MGYFITAEGVVEVPVADEAAAVAALKALNHDHGMKRGGSFGYKQPSDPYESKWYSWMPPRYHEDENLRTVGDVLGMLGFGVTCNTKGGINTYTVNYDDKTGQESVFLNTISKYGRVSITVRGEDGAMWRWHNAHIGKPLVEQEADVKWVDARTVEDALAQEREWYKRPAFA